MTGMSISSFLLSNKDDTVQVHKDHRAPFLMSGCKVADGVGTMLVEQLFIVLFYFGQK